MKTLTKFEPTTSLTQAHDFFDRRVILRCLYHEIGHIRARDAETKRWQVLLARAIVPSVRLVGQFGRTRDGPIEPTLFKHLFHGRGVRHEAGKEQSAKEIRRRH